MDFSFGNFSKARILKLSEDLGFVGTQLVRSERPAALADRPAYVLILTALDLAGSDASGQKPNVISSNDERSFIWWSCESYQAPFGVGNIEGLSANLRSFTEHFSFSSKQQIPDKSMTMEQNTVTPRLMSDSDSIKSLEIKRLGYIESNAPFSCNSFECFPFLTKLKLINLNIQEIAGDISDLQFLETLDLTGNDFKSLPSTMGQIAKLKYLSLQNCRELRALPQLGQLRSLRGLVGVELLELRLENCRGLRSLSEELSHFTKITYLDLSSLEFETIPASIRELPSLGTLCLNKCNHLISLEELPLSLSYLYAHGCESLKNVSLSPHHSIKHLDLSHCFNLHQEQDLLSQFINQGQNQQVKPRFACLPKAEMPRDFENRSLGTCTTISLPPIRDSHSLKPDLNRSSEIDVTSHHLIVIQVPSSIDDEEIDELQFESHLRVAEEESLRLDQLAIAT
ncbi:unnamed protein product [Brassica napus]|uniref:(rape) hypothetical protein n=1 Tax=Brassica napus TaxID=3708 RepID=A0A816QTQ1_BRANA|nr:unnamed protein product [Brassica napus]